MTDLDYAYATYTDDTLKQHNSNPQLEGNFLNQPTENLVPKALAKCEHPLVLGCFVSWSPADQAHKVTSSRTGESVYLLPNGDAYCSGGVPLQQWRNAIRHAWRCLDLIKALV